jgi:MraZ protein
VFLGNSELKIDDKGRVFLPAKYREALAGGVVITRGQEHCLYVWPKDEFFRNAEKWRTAPMSNKQARDYLRVFLSGASDEIPDRQGRVTIPTALRTYAGLERDAVVHGALGHLELWARDRYQEYIAAAEPELADLEEEVLPGLF